MIEWNERVKIEQRERERKLIRISIQKCGENNKCLWMVAVEIEKMNEYREWHKRIRSDIETNKAGKIGYSH